MTLPKRRVIISDREDALLFFLWRHRVSTFQTLRHIFFPTTGNETAYNRLRRLRATGYLRTEHTEKYGKPIWCLGERGFRYLETVRLSDLKTNGYRPQSRHHDLLVMAALLGDWYRLAPSKVTTVTEQELIATEPRCIPVNLKERFTHRPDGLWINSSGKESSAIALEVELHDKSDSRYEEICSFYGGFHFIENVIWILPDKALAKRLQKIAEAGAMPRKGQHIFVLLKDFEQKLWVSPLINSSLKGKMMSDVLSEKLEKPFRNPIETPINPHIENLHKPSTQSIISPLLNFSLSFERSKTYASLPPLPNP